MSNRRPHRYGRGMTIVELLVAMVIGLFMLGATYSMFLAYKRAYSDTEQTSRMSENGRFALQLIASDVRMAGFFGEASVRNIERDAELGVVVGDCTNEGEAFDLDVYIAVIRTQDTDADNLGEAIGCIDDAVPGTAVVVIKSALPVRVAEADLRNDRVYLVTNRLRGVIFRGDDGSRPTTGSGGDVPDGDYWEYRFVAYYIRAGEIPRLSRKIMRANGATQEVLTEDLVDGVDNLHAVISIDSNGDGRVDGPDLLPNEVVDWTTASHLQLYLILRGQPDERCRNLPPEQWDDAQWAHCTDRKSYQLGNDLRVGPFNDIFKRTVVEGSASIRNKAW